jgi:hypothetical protein
MVPLAKNQALCVGVMSYDGQVNFGLIGDYDAMADLDELGEEISAELAAMVDAAGGRRRIFRRDRKTVNAAVSEATNGHAEGNGNGNGNGGYRAEDARSRRDR